MSKEPSEERRRRPRAYGPALDYRTAGGGEEELDGPDDEVLYPDYTGLSTNGLGGMVAATGTESRPTGIRVISFRKANAREVKRHERETGS